MAVRTESPPSPATVREGVARRRFSVEEYHRMLDAGIFHEDDRLELIEGEVLVMSPINPPHASGVIRLARLFDRRLGDRALVSPQNPVHLGEHSEPQPDVMLLKPRPDLYAQTLPRPDEVLLLVEVSDTTVGYDRDVKLTLYARAGIPEAWILNLKTIGLEVYREPSEHGYLLRRLFWRGDSVNPLAFPETAFQVEELLG